MKNTIALITVLLLVSPVVLRAAEPPMNVLLITADDLGYEALDFLGSKVPGVTPNLDKLASQSLSFQHGYVNCAICAPSRSVIATGRYGQNSGLFGFNKMPNEITTVFGTFQKAGFLTGVLGKVGHSTPDPLFKWDFAHDYAELGSGRSPTKYHDYAEEFFARCKKENKPFYFMVNSHDPHRPFFGSGRKLKGEEVPSRIFKPSEMIIPSYVTDLPAVRVEYAHYYNSIRRLDDTVGRVLQALEASGLADRTLVIFLSDNGSPFPFAKANTYLASNKTPLLFRWPGVTKPGCVDNTHFVSEVDFFPTFMEATGLPIPQGLDGRSLVPLFKGGNQGERDAVFSQIDYKMGRKPTPMRCVQDDRYGYIFNAWSDGEFKYKNNNEGETFAAMESAAPTNPEIKARVDMFRYRVPQEFYDLKKDPFSTNNLIHVPEYQETIKKYQDRLRRWMVDTHDFCLAAFDVRENPEKLAAAVANYPELKGPIVSDDEKDPSTAPAADDKTSKRKTNRAAKKKLNNVNSEPEITP